MKTDKHPILKSKHFWIMAIVQLVMTYMFSVTLAMTSPLITNISQQTGWSLGKAGQLNGIVFLLMGLFAFVGSPLMDRLGTKKTALIALALASIGCIMAIVSGNSFALHYIGKFIYGCGWGIFFLVPGAVFNYWLPIELRATFQGTRCTFDLLGYGSGYYIVIPVFRMLNENWQATFFTFGIVFVVIFLAYLFLVPVNEEEEKVLEDKRNRKLNGTDNTLTEKEVPGLLQALKSKWVWIMLFGMVGKIWTYNVYNTFLPAYLELERGMSVEAASAYTGSMAMFGMIAGVVMGVISTAVGYRKLMTWPMLLMIFVGSVAALYLDGGLLLISTALIGFGVTGYMAAYTTIPGEMPDTNPQFYTGAVAIIYGISFMLTFLIPYPFQAMLDAGMTMQKALLYNCIPALAGTIILLFMMETGPKGKYQKELALRMQNQEA